MHPPRTPSARDARQSVRHPPWRLHRSTCTATYPSLRPAPASALPLAPPLLLDHLTLGAESFGSDDDAVAGAADHCARPAPPSSSRQQRLDDDAGCGSSDDHRQQDVIMLRRTRSGRAFPPPISVIGKGGRPWLSLRAHREGGRLVLREMRLPSQELLQPCKEDGRFQLFIHPEAGRRPCGGGGTAGTAREG